MLERGKDPSSVPSEFGEQFTVSGEFARKDFVDDSLSPSRHRDQCRSLVFGVARAGDESSLLESGECLAYSGPRHAEAFSETNRRDRFLGVSKWHKQFHFRHAEVRGSVHRFDGEFEKRRDPLELRDNFHGRRVEVGIVFGPKVARTGAECRFVHDSSVLLTGKQIC